MTEKIWISPRHAFCWLNDRNVIVVSFDEDYTKGHCELLDTVSYLQYLKSPKLLMVVDFVKKSPLF